MTGIPLRADLDDGDYDGVSIAKGTYEGSDYTVQIREIAGRIGRDTPSGRTGSRTFEIRGTTNPEVARHGLASRDWVYSHDNMFLGDVDYDNVGPSVWHFTASYDSRIPNPVGGSFTMSIDTTGDSYLQTYAFAQTAYPATGATATDFGNAIDVQDGQPQGVQRVIPALKIDFRARIATEYLGGHIIEYAKKLAEYTGHTNSAEMFVETGTTGFAQGELLFIGATGELISENPFMTFSFLASKNVTGLTIGDITGIAKKGHEYVWFNHYPERDATTKRLGSSIRAAYVGRVYGEKDLNDLCIGLAPT